MGLVRISCIIRAPPHGVVRHSCGNGQALFLAVCRRIGYAVFVEVQRGSPFRRALQEHRINALDSFSGLGIDQQLMLVCWIFGVAIERKRADVLAVAPPDSDFATSWNKSFHPIIYAGVMCCANNPFFFKIIVKKTVIIQIKYIFCITCNYGFQKQFYGIMPLL